MHVNTARLSPPRLEQRVCRATVILVLSVLIATVGVVILPSPAAANGSLARIESQGNQSSGRWQLFDFDVPASTTITVTGDWTGDGDVNLFLRTMSGSTIAYANGASAKPEVITEDVAAGSYELAVLVKSGSAQYVVDVVDVLAGDDRESLTFTSSGDQNSGRWQVFELSVEHAGRLTASVSWSGTGDVRLFLRENGRSVAWVRTGQQPRALEYDVDPGRNYGLAVLVSTGSASYTATVSLPDGSPPPGPSPSPPPPTSGSFPGEPGNGSLLWGAAVGGNADPVARHERPAGHPLAIRLTYYQWRHRTGYMVDTARDDLANDRLPWVHIKPPSWRDMANGRHDAEIDQMLRALEGLAGPVWLTVHHEPAGGGGVNRPDDPAGPSGHVAMNRRVRQRMDALGIRDVALAPVFMYWTWDDRSGRDIEDWWAPGIYDFVGLTVYREQETSLVFDEWLEIREWAESKGVDVAVSEWGMRGTNAAAGNRVHEWYTHAVNSHRDGRGARVVALVAFDSGLNSPSGSWELRGAQLEQFHNLLRDPRTADVVG